VLEVFPYETDWRGMNGLRPLGSTGLTVSAICAGGSEIGGMPEIFGHDMPEADGIALVRAILDSPIRWIDTSNGYSGGESERRIGLAIQQHGGLPDDFLIATKVDALGNDYSGARVRASVAESKQRLGLDHLPLVYLHDPEAFDFASMRDAVETLMRLRDEGEIGHVGLAGGNVHEMARYLDLGGFEVLLTHNRWTLVDRSATDLLAQAERLGVAVVNAAVFGGGILANPAGSTKYGYREAAAETLQAVAQMDQACREHGTDLRTAALQFSLRDPRITATVVGFSRPSRLDDLSKALGQELPAELWERLESLVPNRHNWLEP